MTNKNQMETHEMGQYKGWNIKSLINNEKGTIEYTAYFEKSPVSGVIMLNATTLSRLKEKIENSNLKKGVI